MDLERNCYTDGLRRRRATIGLIGSGHLSMCWVESGLRDHASFMKLEFAKPGNMDALGQMKSQ